MKANLKETEMAKKEKEEKVEAEKEKKAPSRKKFSRIQYDLLSGQPLIYLVTPEESRAEAELIEMAQDMARPIMFWSETDGFKDPVAKKEKREEDPIEALLYAGTLPEKQIIVMRDLHGYFKTSAGNKIRRMLRDIARDFKQINKTMILLSPVQEIPSELERDIVVVEYELPPESVIATVWNNIYTENSDTINKYKINPSEDEKQAIISAAQGLTTIEAEVAFSKAIVERIREYDGVESPPPLAKLVLAEKAAAVKKSGILEYSEAIESASDIGGLSNLKKWLGIRKGVFTKKAREFGLPNPKGILLVGLPGCGKSLVAKAASNILGVPLIRFDIGRVFGGLVGSSEANMRSALKQIDAINSSVVWIDEMEKAFAGVGGSGGSDSGVSKRVFGTIITWMQEKKSASFIVATVNSIDGLPPELLRKGRFDEIFYVGLPSPQERDKIIEISVRKYGRDISLIKKEASAYADIIKNTDGFSGAEIHEAVISGLYTAFNRGTDLIADYILSCVLNTVPLSKSRSEQLGVMEQWAQTNAVPASAEEDGVKQTLAAYSRKLSL